jgi:DNA-binding MarR family transcriptional regulator
MNVVNEFFELTATETVEFKNLSNNQQRVLRAYAKNRSGQISQLADDVGVSPSYFKRVIEQHGDILDRISVEEMSKQITNDSPDSKTIVYNGTELTETKTEIIEYLARNPNATNQEVANAVGCSISYPSPVRDQYSDLIRQRAEQLGSDLDGLNESIARCQKKRADSWENLTVKQREVLRRLSEEPDPRNPDSSLRDIIQDLPF